jgi:hypothetical protein
VADRPLRPATHRRLGRPLPHQQANAPRAHPDAEAEASFPPRGTSGISPSFDGLSRSSGQVTHVLLTRSRLCPGASPGSSLHLHVLGTPPAFVLSQDQTLREVPHELQIHMMPTQPLTGSDEQRDCHDQNRATSTLRRPQHDGGIDQSQKPCSKPIFNNSICRHPRERVRQSNLDASLASARHAHAVAFSKTAAPFGPGVQTLEAHTRPMSSAGREP